MQNKKKQSEVLLSGPNIYRDKHGMAIYYNRRKKIGYKIPKEAEDTYKTLSVRYLLDLIAFIFVYFLFGQNIWISLGLTVAATIFLEYRWRKYIESLTQVTGFVPDERLSNIDQMADTPLNGLVLRFILYFAVAIMLVVNYFVSADIKHNALMTMGTFAVAVGALYFAYKYLSLIIRRTRK